MNTFLAEQMLILFVILAVGAGIGKLSIKGTSLGTAGVLITALVFGHFGLTVPKEIMDLGLLMFVYSVGLQAGPRFFRTFRRRGIQFVVIALATVLVGAATTVAIAYYFHLPSGLAVGLYTGAMTCTPALAAAIDIIGSLARDHSADVSVGYGIAYPYSMVFVVVLIQLLPKILHRNVRQEEAKWLQEQDAEMPKLHARQFVITNPNCENRRLEEINPHRMSLVNISRVRRKGHDLAVTPEFTFHLGDVVTAVGQDKEMEKLRLLLGEETHVSTDSSSDIVSSKVEVTEATVVGKTLGDLHVWKGIGVIVTRVGRQDLEIVPTGRLSLEMADILHVVGKREQVDEFMKLVSGDQRMIEETSMLPFLIGIVLGIAIGSIPIHLPNGITIKLGIAGGAFLVSLMLGHFGRIGPLRLFVPSAAKNLAKELGLMLFLAGAGTVAGSRLFTVVHQQGWSLFLAGAAITTASVFAGLLLTHFVYRMNILSTMGALCACMTNPPGLAAASLETKTDLPTLAYASVYPVALIFKILIAQALAGILQRLI